jgi:hypothetical protein
MLTPLFFSGGPQGRVFAMAAQKNSALRAAAKKEICHVIFLKGYIP